MGSNNTGEQDKALEKEIDRLFEKLTPAEKRLLDKYNTRKQERHNAPKLTVEHKAPGKPVNIGLAGDNKAVTSVALSEAFGTLSHEFETRALNELLETATRNNKDAPMGAEDVNAIIAMIHSIAPRDETETMLAVQMIATHTAAMRLLRQLKNSDTVPQQDSNGNLAIKLLRTYTMQLEALNRYRGKGQQKMTVEHVHVHPGGQAIVGNVTQSKGGGLPKKREEQPHAKQITHAPVQTMPSPDAQREKLPVPSHV